MKKLLRITLLIWICFGLIGCATNNDDVLDEISPELTEDEITEDEITEDEITEDEITEDSVDPEVKRAIALGIVPEDLQCDYDTHITEEELCLLVGNAVALKDESKIEEWEDICSAATDRQTIRQEVCFAVYLAATLFDEVPKGNTYDSDVYFTYNWEGNNIDTSYGPYNKWYGTWIFKKYANSKNFNYYSPTNLINDGYNLMQCAIMYTLETSSRLSKNLILDIDERAGGVGYGQNYSEPLTREAAILAAVRWYDSYDDEPIYVTPNDERAISQVITAEQIATAADVPEVNAPLIPEWHGVGNFAKCNSMGTNGGNGMQEYYESDIKYMAENGFDFVRVCLGFTILGAPDYPQGDEYINLRELEDLDELIGWCMEYGLHAQISVFSPPKRHSEEVWNWEAYFRETDSDSITEEEYAMMEECFVMLAKRYANVPDDYLSFEIINEAHPSDVDYFLAKWSGIVEKIHQVTPDRLIMGCTDDYTATKELEGLAKMGVALSYHSYEPRGFVYFQNNAGNEDRSIAAPTWPYIDENGQEWSAELIYETYISPVQKIAKDNNVGFMVGEVGLCNSPRAKPIAQEDAIEYGTEMVSIFQREGIAYNHFNCFSDMGFAQQYARKFAGRDGEAITPITYYFDDYKYTFYADEELTKVWAGR